MRVCILLSLGLLGACGFSVSGGTGVDAGDDTDGAPVQGDANVDAVFGCYGQGIVRVCLHAEPPAEVRYTAAMVIDTGELGTCRTDVSGMNVEGACVIAARELRVNASLAVTGPRPLILVATEDLEVTETIDAGSHRGGQVGPGAATVVCEPGASATVGFGGGGGGAGGSFTGPGGPGGSTDGGEPGPAVIEPTTLRAGCPGARGGSSVNQAGAGGAGGGALVLIVGAELEVSAVISVVGQGGQGGQLSLGAGGGGGGSGGMLILDGQTVELSGELNANGGGGGEGADNLPGADGSESPSPAVAGTGGAGGTGGDGGSGSQGSTRAGAMGGSNTAGGLVAGSGGGGGAAGFIKIYGTLSGAFTSSPPPS